MFNEIVSLKGSLKMESDHKDLVIKKIEFLPVKCTYIYFLNNIHLTVRITNREPKYCF